LDRVLTEAIDAAARGELDGVIVSMGPQHGKSELFSKYLPAWCLGTFPDRRVILTSYEADFACGWGRKARDLLEQHGSLFGVRVSKRSKAVNRWDIEGHDGGMTTVGVGGPITGKGANLLIIDDPIKNDEEARSPQIRQKQWDWWQSTASTRMRHGGLVIVIQTRWHRDDLSGRLIREAKETGQKWWTVKLPALAEENDPLGRKPGEALWPDVYSAERLEQVKASHTTYYWRALYQQDPIAEGGLEWPESFFGPTIWFDEWPNTWLCRVVALDPSKGKDSKHGDCSAFVMLQWGLDDTLYIDADLERRNTSIITETAIDIQQAFRPDFFGVETNQFQELLADDMVRRSQERGVYLSIFPVENQVPKVVRIRRLTPLLSQQRLRLKRGSKGAKLLVEQLRDFPCGEHDDAPDALEVAVRLASEQLCQLDDEEYSRRQPLVVPIEYLAHGCKREIVSDHADIEGDCKRLCTASLTFRADETRSPLSGPRAAAAADWCEA
jgi:predicted phage terminase large subunit-like protein